MSVSKATTGPSLLWSLHTWTTVALLGLVIAAWSGAVNKSVTTPYLDEFFHVRQAQKYINGHYDEWDPKITTPPGLYVLSTLFVKVTGFSSLNGIRAINALLLPCLIFVILDVDVQLGMGKLRRDSKSSQQASASLPNRLSSSSIRQLHSAFNACLFPVLFFYSALYYTDIPSVLSVLIFWNYFVRIHEQKPDPTVLQDLTTVLLGLVSLTFRQTNIFWVSIFPAAILFVSKIDTGLPEDPIEHAELLDPPVRESHIDDYFFFVTSLLILSPSRRITGANRSVSER